MHTSFVDVDGVSTRCVMAGSKSAYPLLLLHGVYATGDIWLRNIDVLAKNFRVVAPDMLGHGFTEPVGKFDSPVIRHKVRHLARLADTLGFGRFCPVGSSYGALVAALLYFEMPDRVDHLVMNSSASVFSPAERLANNMREAYRTAGPSLTESTPEMWRERLGKSYYDPGKVPIEILHVLTTCYAQPWIRSAWEATIHDMMDDESFRDIRIIDRLSQMNVSALVVWGKEDHSADHQEAAAAVAQMPNARFELFENCGHLPMVECPERYNDTLVAFLDRPSRD